MSEGHRQRRLRWCGFLIPSIIEDRWTFDLWWLPAPISRAYYRVSGEDGRQVTLFRDQQEERWYQQSC